MAYSPKRVHVGPRDFDNGAATDYWINFNDSANQTAASSATNIAGLSGWLHTTTSLVPTAGGAGDLNSVADYTPSHSLTNAAADAFKTVRIFGGWDQFRRAGEVLGYSPTILRVDFNAAFTVASANESTTFIGMVSGTDAIAAGAAGAIRSGGTASTFFLTSDVGSDAGAAIDTAPHLWRIDFGSTNTEWFSDIAVPGTLASHGTIVTEADIWPQPFQILSGTTNRTAVSWVHIYYV